MRRLPFVVTALSLACASAHLQADQGSGNLAGAAEATKAADARQLSVPALSAEGWRKRTQVDLAAYADALRQNYIYAIYPDPARWTAWFNRTLASVEAGLPLVHDKAGYQAVLSHLAATFQDAHVFIRFDPAPPISNNWPNFLTRLDNGVYRITASRRADITDGTQVTSCDNKPMSWWIATIAQREVGLPESLEVTQNRAALRLFVDRGSPLRPRPALCAIGGRQVALNWTSAPMEEINAVSRSWRGWRKPEISTRLIGADGAWVKLGYFYPNDAAQADAFHTAINTAQSLRTKRFIVLDVRGNGGGNYNWFMAYLRGLYGQPYADHYAIERLHIRAVYRLSSAYLKLDQDDVSTASDFKEPVDPPYEINDAANHKLQQQAIAAGQQIFRSTPIPIPNRGPAPANPVRAEVYVLTDHACASACIGFVDELKRFPGVRQIGLPTDVDSRSGTAVEIQLPSKQASVMIAAMTRDGRIRADNKSHIPSMRFDGDIRDDQAVEAWFLQKVVSAN